MKRTITLLALFVVIIAGLGVISIARKPKMPAPTTQQIWKDSGIPVETAEVTRGDISESISVTGDLNAFVSAVISPKISGRLSRLTIHEGDLVSKGQVVAVLDQGDAVSNLQSARAMLASQRAKLAQTITAASVSRIQTQSAIDQAKANLKGSLAKLEMAKKPSRSQERLVAQNNVNSAKANLDKAEVDYHRNERLYQRGAISLSSLETAKTTFVVAQSTYKNAVEQLSLIDEGGRREDIAAAQAQVESAKGQLIDAKANASNYSLKLEDIRVAKAAVSQAQASVDNAKRELENTTIKSPISGVVSSKDAEGGQVVSPGVVLAKIVDLNSVYLRADVPEKQLSQISEGQKTSIRIDALASESFEGSIASIYPSGSTSNRNFSVRINLLGASKKIKPGMFATADIVTGRRKGVLLVPKDAVDEANGAQAVYRVNSDGIVKKISVKVVQSDHNTFQIKEPSELKVGDRLVTQGLKNVQDGSKIELKNKENGHVAH